MQHNQKIILEISTLLLLVLGTVISYFGSYPKWLFYSFLFVLCSAFILFIFWHKGSRGRLFPQKAEINHILLVNDFGEIQKNWHILGERHLIIGKSYQNQAVDIDLADTEYSVLVAREHAILNFVDGQWYLEDLGSRNGTGIKSEATEHIHKLKDKPYRLKQNDQIFIAKTKLIVR